jgi:hypothetical protein
MMLEELETMTPMNDVRANPIGIVNNWDQSASRGFFANRAKSGSLTINVAKFETQSITAAITAHAFALPWTVDGWWTIGPTPPALTMAHTMNNTPATGTVYDFTVNKCRIWYTGNQIAGNENSQNRKKQRYDLVSVPDPGIPFGRLTMLGKIARSMI